MNWKDVFDGEKFSNKMVGSTTIYKVNEFVSRYTNYAFFSFNGTVFHVRPEISFNQEYVDFEYKNGLKTENLK